MRWIGISSNTGIGPYMGESFTWGSDENPLNKQVRKMNQRCRPGNRLKMKRPATRAGLLEIFADRTGLEPATSAVTGRHSNQLNYRSNIRRLGGELGAKLWCFTGLFPSFFGMAKIGEF